MDQSIQQRGVRQKKKKKKKKKKLLTSSSVFPTYISFKNFSFEAQG